MPNKALILLELAKAQDIEYFEEFNQEDLTCSSSDVRPIFRFVNNDNYSAIDINDGIPGASSFEFIMDALTTEEDYDIHTTENLMILVLNKDLTSEDKKAVHESVILCNYAYNYLDLQFVIDKYTKASNGLRDYYFIPVYLSLFFLYAPEILKKSFWNECRFCLSDCLSVSSIVLSHN